MKKKNIRYLLLLATAIGVFPVSADLKHTITFDRNELILGERQEDNGQRYATVRYKDSEITRQEGSPELPVYPVHLLVPVDVADFSVTINSQETVTIPLSYTVYPVQPPVPTQIESTNYPFVAPDPVIYASSSPYPESAVTIDRDGFFDGNNHILTLLVSPVQYYPTANSLNFIKSLSFTVHFDSPAGIGNNRLQIITKETSGSIENLEELRRIVANKEKVDPLIQVSRSKSVQSVRKTGSVFTLPCYEYCIITSSKLAPAFRRLIAWKRMKGLDTGVVTIEQIKADPNITGDLNSNIFDDAGKIRQYLTDAYIKGTRFVLFGGDYTILPVRYGSGSNVVTDSYYNIPTDLYFSDLNSNWNPGGGNYYGKPSDKLDYWPELYVGRILCTKSEEVERYANKLIHYEMNPENYNFSYVKNAFYTQSDQLQQNEDAQEISAILNPVFDKQTLYEERPSANAANPTFPTGKQAIDEINNGYGFISLHGHGSPNLMTVSSNGINGSPGHYISSHAGYTTETGSSWGDLRNYSRPAIVYSISCTNMPFDDFHTTKINLGESFTVGGDYGGPAYLGNTRYGWISGSQQLYKEFARLIAGGETCIGMAEALSKGKNRSHYECLAHNLLGCPEFRIWTRIPVKTETIPVQRNPSSLTLTNPDRYTAYVTGLFGDDDFFYTTQNNGSADFKKTLKSYSLMIVRPDGFPYIPPMNIQNVTISGTYYLFGSSVIMGCNVGYGTVEGDVVLKNGADVTLEVTDDTTLDYGFEIEPGAAFEIKLPVVR